MPASPHIHVLENHASLADEVADFVVWAAEQTLRHHAQFRIVLAGGSTPRSLYRTLSAPAWASRLPWSRVRFFFGDERCVPPTHADSNYAMAKETLFDPLRIPDQQIARMRGEADPGEAAEAYERAVRQEFVGEPRGVPAFDLVLLGLGDDGHTASLFPGSPALDERARLVVAASAPVGVRQRITMTYSVFNQAKAVVFLVSGAPKAAMVRRILEEGGGDPPLPAARIRPTDGRLMWYLDEAAAAELASGHQRIPQHEE